MGLNNIERTEQYCLPPTQLYHPWLLYFHGINNDQTFCNILDPTKTYSTNIPELGLSQLWTVQYGWCLLANKIEKATNLFLWNPSELNKIDLPPLQHKGIIKDCVPLEHNGIMKDCIFSCSPAATDQVCSIFLFPYRRYVHPNILFYWQLGDKWWTVVDYTKDLVRVLGLKYHALADRVELANPVYCNGRLYACIKRFLVVVEKLPHGIEINSAHVLLPSPSPIVFHVRYWLLESYNELFHIEITLDRDEIISIAVERLDFSVMVWKRVKSIKDRVFFLSDVDLPFACQAISPEVEGGRIYLTLENNNFVHICNIEDNRVVICQAFSGLPKRRHLSMWFRPNLRMALSPQEERGKTQIRAAAHSNKTGDLATNSCALPFEALPLDIIEEVTKCLNALDYLHFRATSSFFRSRAPLLQWRSLSHTSMSSLDDLSLSPLFIFFEKETVLTFVHPKHGVKYKYNINLPVVIQGDGDCEICYSKDGWLLMARNKFSNMFFNPFTKEVKQLAYGPGRTRNIPCVGFSHPSTSPECVVVELHDDFDDMAVHITRLGREVWENHYFEDSNFCLTNVSPCFHNGAFYYLSNKGKLGILKVLGEEDMVWEECEKPNAPCGTDFYKCFLVECNGSLLSVFEGAFGNWIRVFELNESKMIWTRVKSLGNHMLFAGNQSFSAVAKIHGMENKIYFPRFCDTAIVFYSLDTNNYHTFESSVAVDFHCMEEQLNSTWIQPRWR